MFEQHRSSFVMGKAHAAASIRWCAIQLFLGKRLRSDSAAPIEPQPYREPHAPGFEPKPNELFAATHCEIDFKNDEVELIEYKLDRALWMLEAAVRQRMRHSKDGDRVVKPAIVLEPGQRIYPLALNGVQNHLQQPIRVATRVHEGSTRMRLDFEIMLAAAKAPDLVRNCAARLFGAAGQVVLDTIAVLPTLKVIIGGGDLLDANFKAHAAAIVVGVGENAAKVREFASMLIQEARDSAADSSAEFETDDGHDDGGDQDGGDQDGGAHG